MLERFKMSIIAPQGLIRYRKDSWIRVWFYTLIFAILMSASTLVTVIMYDGLSPQEKSVIQNNTAITALPCAIENAVLICDTPTQHTYYDQNNIVFHIDSNPTLQTSDYTGLRYHFVIHARDVHVIFSSMIVETIPIASLDSKIHQLDLSFTTTTETMFFDAIFDSVNALVLSYRPLWGPITVGFRIISALLLFNFFIILNAILIRSRFRVIPFKQLYVMLTYATSLLFVVLIFDSIYQLNFILFILFLFVAFRQTSRLALELQRRVYLNPPKE